MGWPATDPATWPRTPANLERLAAITRVADARRRAHEGPKGPARAPPRPPCPRAWRRSRPPPRTTRPPAPPAAPMASTPTVVRLPVAAGCEVRRVRQHQAFVAHRLQGVGGPGRRSP
ncbi:hypothetical protein C3489_37315 [Streptomyces sp. Ru71]|nr:hypothetical protein C3489_37315 [Streptomyces sp. Ru71]